MASDGDPRAKLMGISAGTGKFEKIRNAGMQPAGSGLFVFSPGAARKTVYLDLLRSPR